MGQMNGTCMASLPSSVLITLQRARYGVENGLNVFMRSYAQWASTRFVLSRAFQKLYQQAVRDSGCLPAAATLLIYLRQERRG